MVEAARRGLVGLGIAVLLQCGAAAAVRAAGRGVLAGRGADDRGPVRAAPPAGGPLARARARALAEWRPRRGGLRHPRAVALLQRGRRALLRRGRSAAGAGRTATDNSPEGVIALLSEELLRLEEEADNSSLACASQEASSEQRSTELQELLAGARQDLDTAEGEIAHYSGELLPTQEQIRASREQLGELHSSCAATRASGLERQREAEKELLELQVTKRSLESDCNTTTTALLVCRRRGRAVASVGGASLMAAQAHGGHAVRAAAASALRGQLRRLRGHAVRLSQGRGHAASASPPTRHLRRPPRVRWRSLLQSLPEDWELPDAYSNSSTNDSCAVEDEDLSLSCDNLTDAADEMEGAAQEDVEQTARGIDEGDARCREEAEMLNSVVRQRTVYLRQCQQTLALAESNHAELVQLARRREGEAERLAELVRLEHSGCSAQAEQLEQEMCEVMKLRQSIYWEFVDSSSDSLIEDCSAGDWAEGECSKTCAERPGEAGKKTLTRSLITNTSGSYGADCPVLETEVECNDVPCPVDCEMSEWSEFSSCSKGCGGGDQIRTRAVVRAGLHGGAACGAPEEIRACNVQACDLDCKLEDWTAWTPCSRRCMYTDTAEPGHTYRIRHVAASASSDGVCPGLEERTEFGVCNDWLCSERSDDDITCSGSQNLVLVMDGSASIDAEDFALQQDFVSALVSRSDLADDGTGEARLGVLLMGGTGLPEVVSQMSGSNSSLESALDEVVQPGGESAASQAFFAAGRLLALEQSSPGELRRGTVVLVTDGGIRAPAAAAEAAKRLQGGPWPETAVKVMVVLVQDPDTTSANSTGTLMCGLASFPCADNVLRVNSWEDLSSQTDRLVAAICPTDD